MQLKLDAAQNIASIGIEITSQEIEKQQIIFDHLLQLKDTLRNFLNEDWIWLPPNNKSEKLVSKIYTERSGVTIMRKEEWPALISFFKPRMTALDEFWNTVKYGFEEWQ